MKLLLSVTIAIKDYFPKDKSIQYENYICLFSHQNTTKKINLSNLKEQNFIKDEVESLNSNIVYNLHILDSNKKSLIGIYQLVINFDKIKNLNVNDTLIQEETAKLIIDPKTKRKIFNKIINMTDIYLLLSIEIKILDKSINSLGNIQAINILKKERNSENYDIDNELNLTPRTFKKKELIRTIKNDRKALNRLDTFNQNNEINKLGYFRDENKSLIFSPESTIKKYNSLNTRKMNQNNIKYIDYNNKNNKYFNNSCTVIMSPKYCNINYNFKKEGQLNIKRKKKLASKKKVTILNLMEQKLVSSSFRKKEENTYEIINQLRDFKNTSINFSKCQINNTKNSFNSLKYHHSFKENKKQNSINKVSLKHFDQSDYLKRKNYNNKNIINVNLSGNKKIEKTFSERRNNIKNNKKKLNLIDIGSLNTEINKNDYLYKNTNFNNIFLQTETTMRKLTERKRGLRKTILTDTDFKKLKKEKNSINRENFSNNKYYREKERGTFSPKLSLKINFNDEIITSTEKTEINTNRYKERINKKILTPKGNKIKKVCFNRNDNLMVENEEFKNKYLKLLDFYNLLKKNLKQTSKNNKKNIKNLENLKQKYNNLNKCKYKIIEMQNLNESKKIKSHANSHYEEEKLLNKMIKIKLKENSIYQNIFENYNEKSYVGNKISILFSKKKEILLSLIKNIIKYYGNISQIHNGTKAKKILFKEVLNKYGIKEKVKTDLNYINYINKGNKFDDKIITEVDEEKENEEEYEKKTERYIDIEFNKNLIDNEFNSENNLNSENITNIKNNIFNNNFEHIKLNNSNRIQEIKIYNIKSKIKKNVNNNINNNLGQNKCNNLDHDYDENLNNLIEKILIEQFPLNYNIKTKFKHLEKNKYLFDNKIYYAYIENNDIVLKEEINGIINNKLTLNEFYEKYCSSEKNTIKSNFIYTKKIKQKYIKIKTSDTEQSSEKKVKNEYSTTIETENKLNMSNSKINEGTEEKYL